MNTLSNWFLRLSVVYLIAGVGFGIFMAASHDHSMAPVHAHINLLGWVSMAIFGLFYRAFPQAEQTRLAKVHFWAYVPALLVQMVALGMLFKGHTQAEPVLAVASILVAIAVACFACLVWSNTRR